jgi:hypothetical protein
MKRQPAEHAQSDSGQVNGYTSSGIDWNQARSGPSLSTQALHGVSGTLAKTEQ